TEHRFRVIIFIFSILLFTFIRIFNIKNSLFFFNDNGRDFYALQTWLEKGTPPLLGPQTSALPINQSAFYFYLLLPLFYLTNQSPISPIITGIIFYISSFITSLLISKKHPQIQKTILVVFFLFTVHPQVISQTRYIWNPSFAPPLLLLSLTSFLLLIKEYKTLYMWVLSASIALAVSFTYSIAPFIFVILLFSFLFIRKYFLKILLTFLISLIFFNLPTIVFDLRHHFLLTTSLLTKNHPVQNQLDPISKVNNASQYLLATNNQSLNVALLAIAIAIALFLLIKLKGKQKILPLLFLSTLLATLISPFTFQAHYIFAVLTLLFATLSLLPNPILIIVLIIFSFFYATPKQLSSYFKPAPRTYNQMLSCFQQVCSEIKDPVFVSVQSDTHPYHNGPEHRYLLKKTGCKVKEIENEPQSAVKMLVIEDSGTFNPKSTNYYELTLFGNYQFTRKWACQDNFQVNLLDRASIPNPSDVPDTTLLETPHSP
ncbi:MAG: hypothetical protein ACOX6N_05070, partial [Patescibacteria group bacterium]